MNILENCNFVRLSYCLILRFILTVAAVSRFSIKVIFFSSLICALLLPTSQSIKAQGANQDSLALVALYNALDGPNWDTNKNWLTGEPVSSWCGIATNDSGRVETIELSSNNLSGTIPPEIGNLSNLENLYIDRNQLIGTIPAEIGNLVSLEYLRFADNQLTGSIPNELGNLINLIKLQLNNNQLSGSIPPEIGNLVILKRLYLNNNQLSGSIPYELGDLEYLVLLQLDNNQLSGSIPPEIGNLKNLQYLFLNKNQLTGSIPPELGNLVILWGLYLNNNQLSSPIPPELWNLVMLKGLKLENNQFTGPIPPQIGNLVNLKSLDLRGNQLTGSIPPEIGNLANLEYLFLAGNQLTGSIPPEIGNLTDLESLSIPNNQLTGSIPPEIGNLTNLKSINLNENKLTGTIPPELGNMLNLQYSLNLENNQLTGEIPPEIGNLVNLGYFNLRKNQLTGSIPTEIGNLTNLYCLALDENQLTGSIPHEIGNLSNLEHLSIHNNQLNGPIPSEIGNLINIKYLYSTNNQLNGSIPSEIGNLVNLRSLDLSHNQLTGTIPPELSKLTNLERLQLDNNQLTGSIPVEIGNLTNLINLWLYNNRLCGSIPQINGNKEYYSCLLLYNNQFNDMTDSLSLTPSSSVKVYSNKLTFEDIEPHIGRFAKFEYTPQDSAGMRKYTTVALGSSLTLSLQVGGSANRYQWIKDSTNITGALDSTLTMSPVRLTDAGEYLCKITNTIVTDLTLYCRPITVHVDTTAIVVFSEPDTLNVVTLPDDSATVTVDFNNESSLSINFTSGNVANKVLSVTQYTSIAGSFPQISVFSNGLYYYDISSDVNSFSAKLTFSYSDSLLNVRGIDEEKLAVSFFDTTDPMGHIWRSLPATIDRENNVISLTTNHFSLWAVTSSDEELLNIPDEIVLHQNYPNPFNSETTIYFVLPNTEHVRITVYNILGQRIKELLNEPRTVGHHRIVWDGRNNSDQKVSSGVYICRLQAGGFSTVKKMLFIK